MKIAVWHPYTVHCQAWWTSAGEGGGDVTPRGEWTHMDTQVVTYRTGDLRSGPDGSSLTDSAIDSAHEP